MSAICAALHHYLVTVDYSLPTPILIHHCQTPFWLDRRNTTGLGAPPWPPDPPLKFPPSPSAWTPTSRTNAAHVTSLCVLRTPDTSPDEPFSPSSPVTASTGLVPKKDNAPPTRSAYGHQQRHGDHVNVCHGPSKFQPNWTKIGRTRQLEPSPP